MDLEESQSRESQESSQEEAENVTKGDDFVLFFSRLFFVRKVIRETEIQDIISKYYNGMLIASILREVNQSLQSYRMEIRRSVNQHTNEFVYVLVLTKPDEITLSSCIFDQAEQKGANKLVCLWHHNTSHMPV